MKALIISTIAVIVLVILGTVVFTACVPLPLENQPVTTPPASFGHATGMEMIAKNGFVEVWKFIDGDTTCYLVLNSSITNLYCK